MTSLLVEIAVLAVLLVTLVVVIGNLPSPGRHGRRSRRPAARSRLRNDPAAVARVEMAHQDAGDVHRVLRPLLREIAAARLAGHHIALDRDREAARAALGDELWEVVRPGRRAPADPRGAGLSLREVSAFTAVLEGL